MSEFAASPHPADDLGCVATSVPPTPTTQACAITTPISARHIGPSPSARAKVLGQLGYGSLDLLVEVLAELRDLAARNQPTVHR